MSVVKGTDFIGWKFKGKHKRVIVVCSEDDEYAISFLLKKQNKRMELSNEELDHMSFIFETAELTNILDDMLQKQPVDLIIIDAFGDVFTGRDMNQNSLVRTFLNVVLLFFIIQENEQKNLHPLKTIRSARKASKLR